MSGVIQLSFTKQSPTLVFTPPTSQSLDISFSQVITPEAGAGSTYTWTQSISLTTWTIPHNLNKFPSVTVVDSFNNKIESDVSYVDNNIIQISHGVPMVGKVYIN